MTDLPVETAKAAIKIVEQAKELVVRSTEDYVEAGHFRQSLKGLEKEIGDSFDEPIAIAHKAHKSMLAKKKSHLDPVVEAIGIIDRKITEYLDAKEKARREEEARQRAEALKAAEAERVDAALALEKEGMGAEADHLLSLPVMSAPVLVESDLPKVAGLSTSTIWKFRVVNAGLVPREYLTVDEKKVGAVIRASQGAVQIPGVEAYTERIVRSGSGQPEA